MTTWPNTLWKIAEPELVRRAFYYTQNLSLCAARGHLNGARWFIAHNSTSGLGSAFLKAARAGHVFMLELLAPFVSENITPYRAANLAASNGHCAAVQFLIECCGAASDDALRNAAMNGHLHVVQFLLERGAERNAIFSSLLMAARHGQLEVVQYLVPIAQNDYCEARALGMAAENGHGEIVTFFLARNVEAAFSQNWALKMAARQGRAQIVRLLMDTSVDTRTGSVQDALEIAALHGHLEVVQLMLERGVQLNRGQWKAVLARAARNGHTHVVDFLKQ